MEDGQLPSDKSASGHHHHASASLPETSLDEQKFPSSKPGRRSRAGHPVSESLTRGNVEPRRKLVACQGKIRSIMTWWNGFGCDYPPRVLRDRPCDGGEVLVAWLIEKEGPMARPTLCKFQGTSLLVWIVS